MNSTETYLIDMEGRIVKRWKSDYTPALSAYLLENGHLLRPGAVRGAGIGGPGSGGGGPGGPPGLGGPGGRRGPGGPGGGPGGLFRSYRYGADYPGLAGRKMTPGEKLEDVVAQKEREAARPCEEAEQ
jgi:hypothetical protein